MCVGMGANRLLLIVYFYSALLLGNWWSVHACIKSCFCFFLSLKSEWAGVMNVYHVTNGELLIAIHPCKQSTVHEHIK